MTDFAENTVTRLWEQKIVAAKVGLRILQNYIWATKSTNIINSV